MEFQSLHCTLALDHPELLVILEHIRVCLVMFQFQIMREYQMLFDWPDVRTGCTSYRILFVHDGLLWHVKYQMFFNKTSTDNIIQARR